MPRLRNSNSIFIQSWILLTLLGTAPCLVFAKSGGSERGFGYPGTTDSRLPEILAVAKTEPVTTRPDDTGLPQPLIETMIDNLLDELSANAEQIKQDPSVAYELSNELVVPYLDFPRITRIIIGKYWRDASDEQRRRLIDEISALLIRSYVTAMTAYADDTLLDEQVVYLPSRYKAGDKKATVRAQISLDSGETIDVRYSLYRKNDRWKIYDISFENVSLALTYRVSFGDIIKHNGLNDLISQLENRNKKGEIDLPGVVTKKMDEFPAETNNKGAN